MTNRKRFGTLLLCIGLILVLSVSSAYIAHEAGHDCSGEDCPICQMIAIHLQLLRTLGAFALLLLPFLVLLLARALPRIRDPFTPACAGTLISWKIRLND